MLRELLLLILNISLITCGHMESTYSKNYRTNSSNDMYSVIVNALDSITTACRSAKLCRIAEELKTGEISDDSGEKFVSSDFKRKKSDDTALQTRSYYGGAASPAFYPAFDPISILASLAFLAFLLQSFVSLFDRSRSIIPAIVSSRDSSPQDESPDPFKLILRALDEYEVLNNDIFDDDDDDDKSSGK